MNSFSSAPDGKTIICYEDLRWDSIPEGIAGLDPSVFAVSGQLRFENGIRMDSTPKGNTVIRYIGRHL